MLNSLHFHSQVLRRRSALPPEASGLLSSFWIYKEGTWEMGSFLPPSDPQEQGLCQSVSLSPVKARSLPASGILRLFLESFPWERSKGRMENWAQGSEA